MEITIGELLRERRKRREKKTWSINPASQLFRISVTEQTRLTNIGRDHLRAPSSAWLTDRSPTTLLASGLVKAEVDVDWNGRVNGRLNKDRREIKSEWKRITTWMERERLKNLKFENDARRGKKKFVEEILRCAKERISLCYGKLEFFLLLLDILSPLEYIFTLPQKLLLKWVRTLSPLI